MGQSKQKMSNGRGLGLIISLLLAALVFVMLVIFSNIVTSEHDVTGVVIAKKDIPKNTVISQEDIKQYFEVKKVSGELAHRGTYTSVNKLEAEGDLLVTEYISANQIVSENMILFGTSYLDGISDPVEMGIKVPSFENAVGGTLRRGDEVDLCTTDANGEEQSIRVRILQAFNHSGAIIGTENETEVAVAFNVLIEREDYAIVTEIVSKNKNYDLIKVNDIY